MKLRQIPITVKVFHDITKKASITSIAVLKSAAAKAGVEDRAAKSICQ